ncbi:MAG: porin [Aquabacterium sp.]|uniref:porin n=1 Tax=Aquabacterium sp. TaxID=1872578 RepID=UPI0025C0A601|nr:porin [Aquabacterium sp.]MBI3380889.1 porin [Aquabacterium sp.]
MKKLPQQRCLVALLCAMGLGSWANSSFADVQYKFSGFGTLGAVKTSNDETEFRQNVDQYRGATKRVDLGVDSRVAVQGSAIFSNGVTMTAQVLGQRREDSDFDAGFEWAFLQYTGIDGLDLKAGRVVLPAFLMSDSRLVGFSMPWVRVPSLVYAMMPLSHVDGVQATYRQSIGPAVASVQLTRGDANGTTSTTNAVPLGGGLTVYGPTVGQTESSRIVGLNAALEWGDFTVRISQIKDNVNLQSIQNIPAVPAFSIPAMQVAAPPLNFKDTFQELGLQYDNGSLVVMAEYVKRSTKDQKVQDAKAWYVGGGYRFGSVLPYVLVSQYKETFSLSSSGIPPKAKGNALGMRYDFANNLALKAEFAQYKNNSLYNFTDSASPGVADKKINVMSVALDFIF